MMIDARLVTRKLVLIMGDLDLLRAVVDKGLDAYQADRVNQAVAERFLERIITRMIDINYHLVTALGGPPPSDYHASFRQLAPIAVLDAAFADQIASAAGLRSRLVHDYDEVDHGRVFAAAAQALRDVPTYVAAVRAFLER